MSERVDDATHTHTHTRFKTYFRYHTNGPTSTHSPRCWFVLVCPCLCFCFVVSFLCAVVVHIKLAWSHFGKLNSFFYCVSITLTRRHHSSLIRNFCHSCALFFAFLHSFVRSCGSVRKVQVVLGNECGQLYGKYRRSNVTYVNWSCSLARAIPNKIFVVVSES